MQRFLYPTLLVAAFTAFGLLIYFNRYIPTPEEIEFDKKFDREAILVKTCGPDPGLASGTPLKVFRFGEKLWYRDLNRWRQIDAKPENVCDLLDIEKGHEPKPVLPPGWSRAG
jgi:hypothetical protein